MAEVDVLAEIYGSITSLVDELPEADFDRSTGCADWTVDALLFHVLLDAQRALMALADPRMAQPDTDRVTYWQKYAEAMREPGAEGPDQHSTFVVRSAAAYGRPCGLVRHWRALSAAAASAARRADPDATIMTQGHLIRVDEFLDTLVVEATIHYLDLVCDLPTASPPPSSAAGMTRRTVEALLGRPAPPGWEADEAIRRLTGRDQLSSADLDALGDAADRVPVIH